MHPSNLRDFDVLFCVSDSDLSKTIRTVTSGEFSHAAHFRVINGKYFIVDAQKNGLTARSWDEWIDEFGYRFVVLREQNAPINEYQEREFDLLGTRYDFESLVIRQPRKIFIEFLNKFRKKQKDSWNDRANESKRLYCSEHIATVRGFAEKQLTPQQLFTECMLRKYKVVKDE